MSGYEKKQKALQVYSPSNCFKHGHKLKTVSDVLKLPSKTLGDFQRNYGREWVINYLAFWLVDLNNNAQVKNKMSEAQIDFTAERIFDTYSLKVTDLTLFFRNVKEGRYGNYYETISQEKIMQWIAEYWEERCAIAEMQNQGRHDKFSLSKDKINPEVAKKMFEGVGEKEVEYPEGEGLGTRTKGVLFEGRNKTILEKMEKIKAMSYKDLKNLFVAADVHDPDFDEMFYSMAGRELELRQERQREESKKNIE